MVEVTKAPIQNLVSKLGILVNRQKQKSYSRYYLSSI